MMFVSHQDDSHSDIDSQNPTEGQFNLLSMCVFIFNEIKLIRNPQKSRSFRSPEC